MSLCLSRRILLGKLTATLAAAGGATALAPPARADAAPAVPHLDPREPLAASLGYVHDARTIDPARAPTYKPGQLCSNCSQLQGAPDAAWRPCALFPNRLVSAEGWCQAWIR